MFAKHHRFVVCLSALLVVAASAAADLSVSGLEVNPLLDLRAHFGSGVDTHTEIMASELNIRFSVNKNDEELVAVAMSPNLKTDMSGPGRRMHFSNYYTIWNFGVDKPKLQLGQFVIPFATLAEYDTHPLILQTPYARTLGVRIDRGLAVFGTHNDTDYQFSLTTGDGRRRTDGSYAANLRLARDYTSGNDAYRIGLSLLEGRQMPVFHLSPMSMPHTGGMHMEPERVDKRRVAVDVDWLHGIDNIRAEFVAGWDDGKFVHGQWISYNHPFSYDFDVTLAADRWQQRNGKVQGLGISLHRRIDELSGVRVAYEPRRAYPDMGPAESIGAVTVQYYKNWVLTF